MQTGARGVWSNPPLMQQPHAEVSGLVNGCNLSPPPVPPALPPPQQTRHPSGRAVVSKENPDVFRRPALASRGG